MGLIGKAAIYSRNGRAFIVALKSARGMSWEGDEVQVGELNPESLASCLDRAFEASREMSDQPPPRHRRWPMLKAAGVKSNAEFYKSARQVQVWLDEQGVHLLKWRPARDGRGLEPDGIIQNVQTTRSTVEIAQAVLKALLSS